MRHKTVFHQEGTCPVTETLASQHHLQQKVLCSHAWLPCLDSSNKNNCRPSQHKVLFNCLGQWLRLVSVIEINYFEQARAATKNQRHGGSEETH